MIKIENVEVMGWEHAIRGMRNPMNSWEKSDSQWEEDDIYKECYMFVGPNDHQLMMNLAHGGPVHAKYRRMITVYLDITAPLYWWKEFDTYKVGTVANSCSTMHKIHAKEFERSDFSLDHQWYSQCGPEDIDNPGATMDQVIKVLNGCREKYLATNNKGWWWQMIQLLPSSYNQRRTVMLNYEVLVGMYESRKSHKLDEWREFCKFIESLPYSELIIGEREDESNA